jgi:excisionase family DNA binding protein
MPKDSDGSLATTPRVTLAELAAVLRLSRRGVQAMAAKGRLPGAARIGKLWTFDRAKIERFIVERELETACANETSTRGARPGGCEPPLTESNDEKALIRGISRLLGKSAATGSKRSKQPRGATARGDRA